MENYAIFKHLQKMFYYLGKDWSENLDYMEDQICIYKNKKTLFFLNSFCNNY